MSTTVTVYLPDGRREALKATPSTTLAQLRDAACARAAVPAAAFSSHALTRSTDAKPLDLALPWRLAGLASGQALQLRRAGPRPAAAAVSVALALPTGARVTGTCRAAAPLWADVEALAGPEALAAAQKGPKGAYSRPCVVFMNREVAGRAALATTTLDDIGAGSGSVLLRLVAKPTDVPYAQGLAAAAAEADAAVAELQASQARAQAQAEARAAAAAAAAAQKSAPAAAPQVAAPQSAAAAPEVPVPEPRSAPAAVPEPRQQQQQAEDEAAEKERALREARAWEEQRLEEQRRFAEAVARVAEAQRVMDVANEADREQHQRRQREEEDARWAAEEDQWKRVKLDNQAKEPKQKPSAAASDVPESERCFAVYAPSDKPMDTSQIEIPDEFYDLTPEDLASLGEGIKRAKLEEERENSMLLTHEMRERMRLKKWEKFKKCMIRVRFPDRIEVQRAFYPQQPLSCLHDFVRGCLADPSIKFTLYLTPPVQVLSNLRDTFFQQGLVPAAVVHFKWSDPRQTTYPILRKDLTDRVTELLPPGWSLHTPFAVEHKHEQPEAQQHQQQPQQENSGQAAPTNPLCSRCWKSDSERNCKACDAGFCAKCFEEVHRDPEMRSHVSQEHAEKKTKKDLVPRWFLKGKKY
eukprot:m51a1_g2233 putative tether containing ubx domain for glut4 (639) ;mRNA; r:248646-250809